MPRPQRQTAVDTMPDFTGRTLDNGRLQLLDKLGSGAYGKVHRALDTTSPSENPTYYAVKCLLKHPSGTDKERLQQREIHIHELVSKHPNMVSFHGCFSDEQFVYIVMGLYTGGDLFGAITEKHMFENQPEKIKSIFVQILDAIQHCHSLGVYHRDIKPENVMCSSDASMVYLGDFGLSTNEANSHDYGCGSSFYMSPECIGPSAVGHKQSYLNQYNDIWALGVILINLITSRNPWRLATPTDACFDAYRKDPDFLKNVLNLTDEVNSILLGVFRFPPEHRLSIMEMRRRICLLGALSTRPGGLAAMPPSAEVSETVHSAAHSKSANTSYSSLDSQYRYGDDLEEASLALGLSLSPTIQVSEELLIAPPPPTRSNTVAQGGATTGNTDSSGDDSSGPITPASNAVDPQVDIPDVSDAMGGLTGPSSVITKPVAPISDKANRDEAVNANSAAQVIKSALQKLRHGKAT